MNKFEIFFNRDSTICLQLENEEYYYVDDPEILAGEIIRLLNGACVVTSAHHKVTHRVMYEAKKEINGEYIYQNRNDIVNFLTYLEALDIENAHEEIEGMSDFDNYIDFYKKSLFIINDLKTDTPVNVLLGME